MFLKRRDLPVVLRNKIYHKYNLHIRQVISKTGTLKEFVHCDYCRNILLVMESNMRKEMLSSNTMFPKKEVFVREGDIP